MFAIFVETNKNMFLAMNIYIKTTFATITTTRLDLMACLSFYKIIWNTQTFYICKLQMNVQCMSIEKMVEMFFLLCFYWLSSQLSLNPIPNHTSSTTISLLAEYLSY